MVNSKRSTSVSLLHSYYTLQGPSEHADIATGKIWIYDSKRGTFLFLLKQGGNYTSEIFIIHMVTLMKVVINLQYHSLKMIYPLLVQQTIIPHFIFNDYMTQKASVFFTKLLKNIKLQI